MPLGQLDDDIGIQVVVSPSLPGLHHYQESPGGQWCLPAPDTDTDEGGQWDLLFFTSEPQFMSGTCFFYQRTSSLSVGPADSLVTAPAAASCCCQPKPPHGILKHFVHCNISSASLVSQILSISPALQRLMFPYETTSTQSSRRRKTDVFI